MYDILCGISEVSFVIMEINIISFQVGGFDTVWMAYSQWSFASTDLVSGHSGILAQYQLPWGRYTTHLVCTKQPQISSGDFVFPVDDFTLVPDTK